MLEVVAQGIGQGSEILAQRPARAGVEVDEHPATPRIDAHGLQAALAAVERQEGVGKRDARQPAVELVRPAVERALDHTGVTALVVCQPSSAMLAGVVEGADHRVFAPHHQDGRAVHEGQIEHEVVAGIRDLRGATGPQPALAPDGGDLAAVEVLADVGLDRDTMVLAAFELGAIAEGEEGSLIVRVAHPPVVSFRAACMRPAAACTASTMPW